MSRENPTWGAPRILSELLLLGHDLAEATVAKYMVRTRKPPAQTWRTFLNNHLGDIAACDFFTIPTVTFRLLYVFIVLRHDRRRLVHFNVTAVPTINSVRLALQVLASFGETGALCLSDGFFGPGKKRSWGFCGGRERTTLPTVRSF